MRRMNKMERREKIIAQRTAYFKQSAMLTLLLLFNKMHGMVYMVQVFVRCSQLLIDVCIYRLHAPQTFVIILTRFSKMFFTEENPFYIHSKLISIHVTCVGVHGVVFVYLL